MPLAIRRRLAPHQLREIRKSTGKLISKETMSLTPALPSESWGGLSGKPGEEAASAVLLSKVRLLSWGWESREGCKD